MDTGARHQLRDTFRSIAKDTGLPDGVLAKIADGHIDGLLVDASVKHDPDAATADAQALNQRILDGNAEIRERLRQTYGRKDGEQLLARTQRFIQNYPKLAAILREDGLGSRPDIVEEIVSHVHSTVWR
jgi:hypothetical protein